MFFIYYNGPKRNAMFPLATFNRVIHQLEQRYSHLARGQMLSSPAIEYKGRAFAFCQQDKMIIKYLEACPLPTAKRFIESVSATKQASNVSQ